MLACDDGRSAGPGPAVAGVDGTVVLAPAPLGVGAGASVVSLSARSGDGPGSAPVAGAAAAVWGGAFGSPAAGSAAFGVVASEPAGWAPGGPAGAVAEVASPCSSTPSVTSGTTSPPPSPRGRSPRERRTRLRRSRHCPARPRRSRRWAVRHGVSRRWAVLGTACSGGVGMLVGLCRAPRGRRRCRGRWTEWHQRGHRPGRRRPTGPPRYPARARLPVAGGPGCRGRVVCSCGVLGGPAGGGAAGWVARVRRSRGLDLPVRRDGRPFEALARVGRRPGARLGGAAAGVAAGGPAGGAACGRGRGLGDAVRGCSGRGIRAVRSAGTGCWASWFCIWDSSCSIRSRCLTSSLQELGAHLLLSACAAARARPRISSASSSAACRMRCIRSVKPGRRRVAPRRGPRALRWAGAARGPDRGPSGDTTGGGHARSVGAHPRHHPLEPGHVLVDLLAVVPRRTTSKRGAPGAPASVVIEGLSRPSATLHPDEGR